MDSDLWHVCAGPFAHLPAINSVVSYFPQGHAEHGGFPSSFLSGVPPLIHCRVSAVERAADPNTDEVFAKISLVPITFPSHNGGDISNYNDDVDDVREEERNPDGVIWCAKFLTQSDANNGGGFSVPKVCADKIFPPLDFSADPPVQEIHPRDIHGGEFKFRHIFRGTPRRHLLTSGWSVFVNKKSLVAGDALVFMRTEASTEIRIGIRRDGRRGPGRAPRITSEEVEEAARSAAAGRPFEVVYEPCRSNTVFLVRADVAMRSVIMAVTQLREGTKVAVEVEDISDFSKKMIRTGSVTMLQQHDPNWRLSPWRLVQVKLDEEEGEGEGENVSHFNPWSITVESEFELPEFTGDFPVDLHRNSGEPNHQEESLPLVPTSDSAVVEEPKLADENNVTNKNDTTEYDKNNDNNNNNNKKTIMLFGKVIDVAAPVENTESPPSISSSLVKLPTDDDTSPHPKKKRTTKNKLLDAITNSICKKSSNGRKRRKEDSF